MINNLVHLIEGDDAVRRSLSFLLRHGGYEVEVWSQSEKFLTCIDRGKPACILLRTDALGGAAFKAIAGLGMDFPFIVLTDFGSDQLAARALRCGAADFLEIPIDRQCLMNAIAVAITASHGSASRRRAVLNARDKIDLLTRGERETLDGIACGLSRKKIVKGLGITADSLDMRRAAVLMKFDVTTMAAALRIAFDAKLGCERQWVLKHTTNVA